MAYDDTYNTLKYADRAQKIKLDLKQNVYRVDHSAYQYGKIVEQLQTEVRWHCKGQVWGPDGGCFRYKKCDIKSKCWSWISDDYEKNWTRVARMLTSRIWLWKLRRSRLRQEC